ncbi:PREDICTED: E3 ubiquitin-protein ligase RNF13-like [Chinchilla lanigera]|uniref:E3 ubiquitin-protein ligase RNF13-like n=1 Tax=Chinchilla lanigera TaxID=34839 RepID=UPI00038ECF4A|nr:PREDICTED: E3 ubiquitin-protein ligase RNF13-like [Chinchilla lanigera]
MAPSQSPSPKRYMSPKNSSVTAVHCVHCSTTLVYFFMEATWVTNSHHASAVQITKFVQDRHRDRRNGLGKDQLKKLPVHKFKKGDEYDVCAICLDKYEDEDKLRILSCSHAYHCRCVDTWLTKTKKTCPVCKQTVVPSQGDSDSDTDSSQEEKEVSEHTFLLGPLASVSAQSFGALSESHSHQNMTESSDFEDNDHDDTDSSEAESEVNELSIVAQLQPNGEWDCDTANTV